MVAARSTRARSDKTDRPTKKPPLKRTKVLTTAMDEDRPRAVKTTAKKAAKPVAKKIAGKTARKTPKKTVAKKKVVKTTATKRSKPETQWHDPREPRPERRSATERLDDPPPATGAELVERVSWAIERELNQIEMIVGGHRVKPTQRTEAERRARTLASLARTLSEVARLRAQHQQSPDNDDDAMPRDLDEFRETLARRLEQLLAARSDPADGDVQSG